ncbi:recombination-associated protein RdgC [Methylomonas sp. AM2-LC]|uniref:recombination-associated protein RdgC n=1 Tax=Methylomonas sp. AM2-LC TaxID=3153301 RepID=UPI003263C018
MFKNATVYTLEKTLDLLENPDTLVSKVFVPCPDQAAYSAGWVKPTDFLPDSQLVHRIGRYDVIGYKIESKILPSAAINKVLNQRISEIEERESRRVRAKERASIKDEVIFELIPRALSRESTVLAYIDRISNLIVVNTASASVAENVLSLLRKTLGSLWATPIKTNLETTNQLTQWLINQVPKRLELGRSALIHKEDEGVVRIKNIELLSSEVRGHLDQGGLINQLSLTWDSKISFDIDKNFALKKIRLLDLLMTSNNIDNDSPSALFEADILLFADSFSELFDYLIEIFGGLPVENLSEHSPS